MEKGVEVLPLNPGIIYGPINSRRLGRSLGINLSPVSNKLCSFNCIYCHYGWTERLTMDVKPYRDAFPSKQEVLIAVREALQTEKLPDYITFSGNGESTLHPDFSAIVYGVRRLRDELAKDVPLAILTNSSTLKVEIIRKALEQIDVRIFKLDAGTEQVFQALNGPLPSIRLEDIVNHLSALDRVTIQTIFLRGTVDNTEERQLAAWIALIGRINPDMVQIYSTDRPVPQRGIKKVSRELLERIASSTTAETGVRVSVYSMD